MPAAQGILQRISSRTSRPGERRDTNWCSSHAPREGVPHAERETYIFQGAGQAVGTNRGRVGEFFK
jgi:hypothetical protein